MRGYLYRSAGPTAESLHIICLYLPISPCLYSFRRIGSESTRTGFAVVDSLILVFERFSCMDWKFWYAKGCWEEVGIVGIFSFFLSFFAF